MTKKHKKKKDKKKKKDAAKTTEVVIVGAGFAGIGCAKELAKRHDVHVTLLDKHNYHQFLPLLYQVATYQLSPTDVAMDLRQEFRKHPRVSVKMGEVASIDPSTRSVAMTDGGTFSGDYIVLAAGSQANFFDTPGAEHVFPLYSLDDAERLRSRLLAIFEDADRDPSLVDKGALNVVVVGAGATGTEVAGAIGDLVRDVLPSEFHDLAVDKARVIVVDLGDAVLGPFSPKAHAYASKVLLGLGVELRLGTSVKEIARDHVVLSDGSTILTHCVVWGGGLKAAPLAGASGLKQGRGGRIDVEPDLTVADHPGHLRRRRHRQHPRRAGHDLPAAGIGGAAGRKHRGRQHHRGHRRETPRDVRLSRQGDHGDDRPRGGGRRGG